jgi:outer membrane protein assembly factor BamB
MKRLLIIIFGFQIMLTTGSCKKPEPIEPPLPKPIEPSEEKYPTNLEVVWLSPLFLDSAGGGWIWDFEIANEQYIIVANTYDSDGRRPRGIGVYNMQTGERHSAWKNDPGGIFGVSEYENLADCKIAGINKDVILIYSEKNLFAYSLHTGQRMWSLTISGQGAVGIPKISAEGDNAFICYGPGGGHSKSWFRLAMVNVYSGEKREVLQLEIEDNFEFDINPPSACVMDNGDTLLFFTTEGLNFKTLEGRGYTYCYNLTKGQTVWINKPLTTDRNMSASAFNPVPFLIENDRLIVTPRKGIYCLDKNTGEFIWKREDVWLADCPPLYHEGKIYIRSGSSTPLAGFLLCLDAQSGQMLWENTTIKCLPAPDGNMAIYKDRLYFSASGNDATYHLACVDIHTGEELWRDLGPYGNICFSVLIDQKTGYLYCYTGWATMCVDLNKTPNK